MRKILLAATLVAAAALGGCAGTSHLSEEESEAIRSCIGQRTMSGITGIVSPLASVGVLYAANKSEACRLADKKWDESVSANASASPTQ
jgi:hypothetical protein